MDNPVLFSREGGRLNPKAAVTVSLKAKAPSFPTPFQTPVSVVWSFLISHQIMERSSSSHPIVMVSQSPALTKDGVIGSCSAEEF